MWLPMERGKKVGSTMILFSYMEHVLVATICGIYTNTTIKYL